MKIKDRLEYLSKPEVYSADPEATVFDAAQEMSARNIGSVVVTDGDKKVVGLVTERDVMRRVVAADRKPAETSLADIMTTDLRLAKEDDSVVDWLRVMSNERFRRLPVVDSNGRLVTIMTQGDFVSYTWPELLRILSDRVEKKLGINNQHILIITGMLLYSIAVVLITQFAI